jgi:hypothetical protein
MTQSEYVFQRVEDQRELERLRMIKHRDRLTRRLRSSVTKLHEQCGLDTEIHTLRVVIRLPRPTEVPTQHAAPGT